MAITGVRRAWARNWPAIACVQVGVITLAGIALALWWRPEPHSDWLLYWLTAGDPTRYERGGLGLWLLAIPKAMGLPPALAALTLNIPAVVLVSWLAFRVDRSQWKWRAQLVFAYLLLLVPYLGIVQLDLLAAAFLATGFCLLLDHAFVMPRGVRIPVAAAAIAVAVSTRPQYALTLWTLLGMGTLLLVLVPKWRTALGASILATVLVASLAGFSLDMGMRLASGEAERIRTSSAVTLYAGLLVSADSRKARCGFWTPAAAEAAKQDLGRPLHEAVKDRLQARPPAHWASVVACKARDIVLPRAYALYWLTSAPNVVERLAAASDPARAQRILKRVSLIEVVLHALLVVVILATTAWTALRERREAPQGLLPAMWILSFWLVHSVFEIQGRYFLGMLLLAPILCAMAHPKRGARSAVRPMS